jgi:endonuclease G
VEVVQFHNFGLYSSLFLHITMPGIGPSLVFAAGLAVGVGAGSFIPKKSTKEIGVLPPPPVERYDVVKRLPTATGSVVLQGGFPGTLLSIFNT